MLKWFKKLLSKNKKCLIRKEIYTSKVNEIVREICLLLNEINEELDRYILEVNSSTNNKNIRDEIKKRIKEELLPKYDKYLFQSEMFLEKEIVYDLEIAREGICIIVAYDGVHKEDWKKMNVLSMKEMIEGTQMKLSKLEKQ